MLADLLAIVGFVLLVGGAAAYDVRAAAIVAGGLFMLAGGAAYRGGRR